MTDRGSSQNNGLLGVLAARWNEAQQGAADWLHQAQQQIQQKERDLGDWTQERQRDASAWLQHQGAAAAQAYKTLAASRNPQINAVVGQQALETARPLGAARAAWHTAEGLAFLRRLTDPVDFVISRPGESAWDDVFRSELGLADYIRRGVADPQMVAGDVADQVHRFWVMNDPYATPPAPTLAGEVARNINIGTNQGETVANLAMIPFGAEEAAAAGGLRSVAEAGITAENAARNAEYFALPYRGMGHHYLPRRTKIPTPWGDVPVPQWISESPFFLLKPENMTNGDFYRLHYQVDPFVHGGRVPREFGGGGWSGKSLGWQKDDLTGQLWNGAPPPLKATVGGGGTAGALGAANLADQIYDQEQPN